jgi:hypothetical protein
MNRPNDPDRDPREWLAQERALQLERQGAAAAHDDPQASRYRPVVRALREPLADGLPADFAQRVALLAERAATARTDLDLRLERNLMRGLVAAFVLVALAASALYGQATWQAIAALVPGPRTGSTSNWLVPALGCVALSWALGALRAAGIGRGGTTAH